MARIAYDTDGNEVTLAEVADLPGVTAGDVEGPSWADSILPDPFLN